ncbi:MAG: hypothetical protein AUH40_10695 [Chloroflexi bacterium 13_1_40CM_65_17]|nr:MAG: hypothetical protein AUH40_10695 [Chloroflexi bacterium 13_1_40CM_65_17]
MDPIVLDGVGFAFPALPPLLHDVNLTISEGEVVALVGPTGCGKSTLLHICAGVIPHFISGDLTGIVRVFGTNTAETSLARIASNIGTVTQDPENQLFNLIVADEIAWGMENRGFARPDIRRGLDRALDFFRIPHLRDRITYDLSGGEKQRVVLAANYAPAPKLFVLDDPTSQLDPIGAQQVLSGIQALAESGQTILLVESKLEEIWSLVDRVVLLHNGTIELDTTRDQLDRHLERFTAANVPLPQLVELGARLRRRGVAVPALPPNPDNAAPLLSGIRAQPVESERPADETRRTRVDVKGLSYRYPPPRRTLAVDGVDLEIPAGSVVGVVGQNGSGKTTLARCLSGHLSPSAGSVSVDGRDVHRMSVRERAATVGYVFQNPDHQIFKDPVLEDVVFGPVNLGATREKAIESAERVLRALDLWEVRNLHPFRLSKGGRQRLAIAAIAVMQPPVMIIDEPTTGQDLQESHAIMTLLVDLARDAGQTVIVITHAMHLVAEHCDLMAALFEGRLIAFGPPEQVFRNEELLRQTFVKPPAVTALGNRLGLEPRPLTLEDAIDRLAGPSLKVARG